MKKGNVFSAIALLISISALCVSIFRSDPITIEWAEVLVGVLSILVTVLIGYQIYNAVSVTTKMKSIQNELRSDLDIIKSDTYNNIVRSILIQSKSQSLDFFAENGFLLGIEALRAAFKYDTNNAEHCIEYLIDRYRGVIKSIDKTNLEIVRNCMYSPKREYKRINELREYINSLEVENGVNLE